MAGGSLSEVSAAHDRAKKAMLEVELINVRVTPHGPLRSMTVHEYLSHLSVPADAIHCIQHNMAAAYYTEMLASWRAAFTPIEVKLPKKPTHWEVWNRQPLWYRGLIFLAIAYVSIALIGVIARLP